MKKTAILILLFCFIAVSCTKIPIAEPEKTKEVIGRDEASETAEKEELAEAFYSVSKYLTWIPVDWTIQNESMYVSLGNFNVDGDSFTCRIGFERGLPAVKYPYSNNVHGTIKYNEAFIDFDNASAKGKLRIRALPDGNLDVAIEYSYIEERYQEGASQGTYMYRPYNIADDNSDIDKVYDMVLDLNLERLGEVRIIPVQLIGQGGAMIAEYPKPQLYVVNTQGDIFYTIYGFHDDSEFVDMQVKDLNGDGLIDLLVTTKFIDASQNDDMEYQWYFYQDKKGVLSYHHLESMSEKEFGQAKDVLYNKLLFGKSVKCIDLGITDVKYDDDTFSAYHLNAHYERPEESRMETGAFIMSISKPEKCSRN